MIGIVVIITGGMVISGDDEAVEPASDDRVASRTEREGRLRNQCFPCMTRRQQITVICRRLPVIRGAAIIKEENIEIEELRRRIERKTRILCLCVCFRDKKKGY